MDYVNINKAPDLIRLVFFFSECDVLQFCDSKINGNKNKQSDIVARWKQLYFQERQAKTEGNAKADVIRGQMAVTELAKANNL